MTDPVADTGERAELRAAVRRLVADVAPPDRIRVLDEAEQFDDVLYDALARLGVFSAGAPAHVGGVGDVRDQLVVVEEVAAGPTSMAAFLIAQYAVTQVLGNFGNGDEHRAIVDALLAGRTKVSFSMSEAGGGTDVARVMRTRAERVAGGGWRITGEKMWTSGAALASHLVVLARTTPIERSPVHGVTMFLVPTDAAGVQIRALDTFGIHGMSTCAVVYDDVVVTDESVLGEVDAGMRQVFATINREGLNAAAACIGAGRGALELAVQYAKDREVFGKPVGAFQTPQHWLVDGAVALESARGLMVRRGRDRGGGWGRRQRSRRWRSSWRRKVPNASPAMACSSWAVRATAATSRCSASSATCASGASRRSPTRWCATASASRSWASRAPTDQRTARATSG